MGGFSAVDFQCKVMALHVQWVRQFVSSPSSWVSFMVFWFSSLLFFFFSNSNFIEHTHVQLTFTKDNLQN